MDDMPWGDDRDRLAKGLVEEESEQVKASIDDAAAKAKAGNLADAAEPLETARRILVARNNFRRHDNDIWVFTDVIRCIRRQSSEAVVPPAYQRFMDAVPSARMDEEMTRAQKAFWYGSEEGSVGGEIRLVGPREAGRSEPKKGCFVATAVCGEPDAWEVEALRAFRDRALLCTRAGRQLVELYYVLAPSLAAWIQTKPGLRRAIRTFVIRPLARACSARTDRSVRPPRT
jgi:hypothetical protein